MIQVNDIKKATEIEQQEAHWLKDALEFIENLLFDAEETMDSPLPKCLREQLSQLYSDLQHNEIRKHFKENYRLLDHSKLKALEVQQGILLFSPKTIEARTLLGLQEVILYRYGYIKKENLKFTDPEKGFRYIDPENQ